MAGRKLADLPEDGRPSWNIMETQVGIQRLQIDRPLDTLILQDRLELGGKHNGAFRQDRVVERLLAEAIARQHERTRALVPHGEGEHPAESVNTALPALLVEVHDHLSVRLRTERRSEEHTSELQSQSNL